MPRDAKQLGVVAIWGVSFPSQSVERDPPMSWVCPFLPVTVSKQVSLF